MHLAYQVVGDGPIDLVYVPAWFSHVELLWEEPSVASFFERLASFSRLIMFDRRGAGLSDPIAGPVTLEEQMDDVACVMDAADSERAGVFAQLEGGSMATLFAATHPERVGALILYSAFARTAWAPDYDWPPTPAAREVRLEEQLLPAWGQGVLAAVFAPSLAHDGQFREWFGRLERYAASPATVRNIFASIGETDVRGVLSTIRVPTLVMHRSDADAIDIRHSRYLAEHIRGARFIELPGRDTLPTAGASEALLDEMEEFLTGARHEREPDRVLATVLFTDIVDSTRRAAELGDSRWRSLLERHYALARRQLTRFRGREVKTTGDGLLATFDGPARGIRCAVAIGRDSDTLGLPIRAGLHTGECEAIGDDVGGMAVHIGARVAASAGAGEVLVSSTVRDLVVGSGIDFDERGAAELKGVPGEWRLFAVRTAR